MRYLLLGLALLVVASAQAQAPTRAQLDTYQAFSTWNPDTDDLDQFFGKRDAGACFLERICEAAPVGEDLACERELGSCLAYAAKDDDSDIMWQQSRQRCSAVFQQFTAQQSAMLSQPQGCEVPASTRALQPVFTPSEARCLAGACPEDAFGSVCQEKYTTCTLGTFQTLSPSDRATCRSTRSRAISYFKTLGVAGSGAMCRVDMSDEPSLAAARAAPSVAADRGTQAQPRSQAIEAANPQLRDESDLDDLDF